MSIAGRFFWGLTMLDNNWDLINGPIAHEIEVLNYSSQVNFIEALVKFAVFHLRQNSLPQTTHPSEAELRELHRTGTLLLLRQPGVYRTEDVSITKGSEVVHQPPSFVDVQHLMDEFRQDLASRWGTSTPVEIASFCLWRVNWIHPFKNGNGRTARAFSYACLCLKYGFFLPGKQTVIDLIMENRPDYYEALKQADNEYTLKGAFDLTEMNEFIEKLLAQQLSSIES